MSQIDHAWRSQCREENERKGHVTRRSISMTKSRVSEYWLIRFHKRRKRIHCSFGLWRAKRSGRFYVKWMNTEEEATRRFEVHEILACWVRATVEIFQFEISFSSWLNLFLVGSRISYLWCNSCAIRCFVFYIPSLIFLIIKTLLLSSSQDIVFNRGGSGAQPARKRQRARGRHLA